MTANETIRKMKKFLGAFGNPTLVYNRDVNKVSAMIKTNYSGAVAQNKQGKDVYFYINEGGTKEVDITKLRACFVDLDAGRDTNGKYYDMVRVRQLKGRMSEAIEKFKLAPTYVVETRNGYQLYWVLYTAINVNQRSLTEWKAIQAKLNNFFKNVGADSITRKVNQIFRVPHLKWHKRWEGKAAFDVKLAASAPKKVYTMNQLIEATSGTSSIISYKTYDRDKKSYQKQSPVYAEDYLDKLRGAFNAELDNTVMRSNPNSNTVSETISFLLEAQKTFHYMRKQFMSQSAERLANELSSQFCV